MELPFFTTTTGGGGGGGSGSSSSSSATTRAEALRWLAIAEKLLAGRDLVGSKSFAARARESDPTLVFADQIIAVADTLLAGDKRISNLPDWYAVLQLTPQQSRETELIAGQYRKLALLLNPQKNKLPFADQAFTLVVNAWQVLSNPSRKNMYDSELMAQLRVSPVSSAFNPVSSGFNPVSSGVTREQMNYQPFEINFQVMPQHTMSSGEQVVQPQPQHWIVREPQPPSQILPQQNLTREPRTQRLQQQNLSREQMVQAQPPPQPQPPPQTQPSPQSQPQPQQQRKETFVGNNVTRSFSSSGFNVDNTNTSNINNNDEDNNEENDDDSNVNARDGGRRGAGSSEDGVSSFWTACPYCYYMYEYPNVYAECTLKCQNCKRAFHGVVIPSPPPIVDRQDGYFCCWGLMPLGVSMEILERTRGKAGTWTPFSPMFTCPKGMGNNWNAGKLNNSGGWNVNNGSSSAAGPSSGNAGGKKKSSGPRVYVDDDDVFLEYSDASEESDGDWRTEKRKKKAKGVKETKAVQNKGTGTPGRRGRPPKINKGKNHEGVVSENVQEGLVVQEAVRVPNASPAESSKKLPATNARRNSARVAKDFGKLDLNVEFNNNEVEEPAPRVIQGNVTGRGEDDIIEGGGFFEGLDEFLSTLPILNVVGDDKVKAA